MKKIRVAVLMGGKSSERDISLRTGKAIMKSLDAGKYDAYAVDAGDWDTAGSSDMVPFGNIVHSRDSKPDVVFIALHGRFGEDGTVQGFLEVLGIPYVGSGVLASALAIDKIMSRRVLTQTGIPVPKGIEIGRTDIGKLAARVEAELGLPAVVKPSKEGSSIGLSIPETHDELIESLKTAYSYDDNLVIEEFVQGTEISVPILGDDQLQVLPVIEIVPVSGFYDYENKYTDGATEHIIPARISTAAYRLAEEFAAASHKALGCRDISRTDMIVSGDELVVLETNTLPGMTSTSLLPHAAQAVGIGFSDLLDRLIGYALSRG